MHPHTKFRFHTSNNVEDIPGRDYSRNEVKGQGGPKMVRDTPPSQDAPTHQIWDSSLK